MLLDTSMCPVSGITFVVDGHITWDTYINGMYVYIMLAFMLNKEFFKAQYAIYAH